MTPDGAAEWLHAARSGGLPEPPRERWTPLRVGLCDLWEYDDAELWFAGGRLVLRGGNGTGKTKILELTTLMLLRGEIRPEVLDPFGSQHRNMAYNLLPSGEEDDPRLPADSGLGYAWIEFGRREPDGRTHYFTCGLGAAARRGSGSAAVDRWMFVTQRRPGADLRLREPAGCLAQKDLRKEPGVRVMTNAEEYRTALARELFGLDVEAYDNLTELLKQLRRPKLGERLNPNSLAATLSDALPPLAQAELTQLAEGWDRLDALHKAVQQLEDGAAQVADFSRRSWLPWGRIVVHRRAQELSQARTQLDNTTRDRRQAEEALDAMNRQVDEAFGQMTAAAEELSNRRIELEAHLNSAVYKAAATALVNLEHLEKRHAGAEQHVGGQVAAAERARKRLGEASVALDTARDAHTQAKGVAGRTSDEVRELSVPAGLAVSAETHLGDRRLEQLFADHGRRAERLRHQRTLHKAWDAAVQKLGKTESAVAERRRIVREQERATAAAEEAVRQHIDGTARRLREWAERSPAAAPGEAEVAAWVRLVVDLGQPDHRDPATPLTTAIQAHLGRVRERIRREREGILLRRQPLADRQAELQGELAAIREAGETAPPEPSQWARRRRPSADDGLGAPFWRCVQPRSGLDQTALDAMEAALAASGLLDAWITPEGEVVDLDSGGEVEIVLHGGAGAAVSNLTQVLDPTPAGGVLGERISAVLRRIGWFPSRPASPTAAEAWLAGDGTWRLGPLEGYAEPVQPASHLGASARELARQRAVERLEAAHAVVTGEIGELDEALVRNEDAGVRLEREAAEAPDEQAVLRAVIQLEGLVEALEKLNADLEKLERQYRAEETARDHAWSAATTFAAEHGFRLDDLDAVADALGRYRQELERLAGDLRLLNAAETALAGAEARVAAGQADLESVEVTLRAAAVQRDRLKIEVDVARESLDQDAQQQLRRKDDLAASITVLERRGTELGKRREGLLVDRTKAEGVLQGHTEQRERAERRRNDAMTAWWAACDAGLFPVLGLDVPDVRNVETAREGAAAAGRAIRPAQIDQPAEERAWRACQAHLVRLSQALLPNRDVVAREPESADQLVRVEVLVDPTAGWLGPAEAADVLAEQVRQQRARYDEEQQRVLLTLLGSTFIEHLKERLDYANAVFHRIDQHLVAHPTRQGHALRLDWDPLPSEPHARQVVEALRQGYEHLAEPLQQRVRSFLSGRIDQAREDAAAEGSADWRQHLAAALDYRRWLRVRVLFRSGRTGDWKPFDARRHGEKSGGEKVVLLAQPLFAAAVVAYGSANDVAPRMVWLDEAMTGVDEDAKASFMGLTVELDLDVMLTAHDEWCTYETVPLVAIYDLARVRYTAGVDLLPFLWSGGELVEVGTPDGRRQPRVTEDLLSLEPT